MAFFGNKIRIIRKGKGLLLRQVAAFIEVDTAFLSKVERGEKKASREQVIKLAEHLNYDCDQLLVIWLSDKIIETINHEPLGIAALRMALEQTIKV